MTPKSDSYVYVHPDGRVLWGTESRTEKDAIAKAVRMDVPTGGRVEPVSNLKD